MIKQKIEIKQTSKYGKGVFAKKNLKKGELIFILGGKRIDSKEFVRLVNSDREKIDDPFQFGKRTYFDLNKKSRMFNHSCNPNGGIRKNSELFALRDIEKGEEITFDYSLTIAPTDWKMMCKCSTKICRKIVGDIRSVPKDRLDFYMKNGAIQKYMKPIIKELEKGIYKIPKYEIEMLNNLKLRYN